MSTNHIIGILIILYLVVTFLALLWKINDNYKLNLLQYPNNSKGKNILKGIKDFLTSDGVRNRGFLPIIFIIAISVLAPIIFILIFTIKILPSIIIFSLTILSGFVFFIFFLIMIMDTIKSIKKEKFKTTIKTRPAGFVAFFVFIICLYAYFLQ